MGAGSRLQFNEGSVGATGKFNALGTNIIMNTGATIDTATQADPVFPTINLAGNGFFLSSTSAADRDLRAFGGAITGSGSLNLTGRNVEVWSFITSNNFNGGLNLNAVDRYVIRATGAGSMGAGDVTITPRANADLRSAVINVEASDVFASTATLSLTGRGGNSTTGFFANFDSTNRLLWLAAGTSNTVAALTVNGVPIAPGTYSGANGFSWLGGVAGATLTVVPEPASATLLSLAALALLRRRR